MQLCCSVKISLKEGKLPTNNKEILKDKDLIEEYKELIGNSVICEDKDILEDILDYYNPESFTDLIRVISLVHGTGVWEDNGRSILIEGVASYGEIITTREDVYEMLLKHEIPKEKSYEITEYVRKGKFGQNYEKNEHNKRKQQEFENIMCEYDVPEWFVESCRKVRYLFSRAHAAEYACMILEMAYFHRYHRDLYEKIYEEIYLVGENLDNYK